MFFGVRERPFSRHTCGAGKRRRETNDEQRFTNDELFGFRITESSTARPIM